jgi:NAD(P)-dependent dehydrogenase (short-subunit alcohol dehydrogenase family)
LITSAGFGIGTAITRRLHTAARACCFSTSTRGVRPVKAAGHAHSIDAHHRAVNQCLTDLDLDGLRESRCPHGEASMVSRMQRNTVVAPISKPTAKSACLAFA